MIKTLASIEVSGSLLSEALLITLSKEVTKNKLAQPKSFRWYKYDVVDTQAIYELRIANAYEQLIAKWDFYSNDFQDFTISELRDKWLKFFFQQFGYNLQFQKADVTAGELRFPLSHRGWDSFQAPIVHTVLFNQELDRKVNDNRHKYSPHDTLQRYLINTDCCKWGLVTNGKIVRLLRDFHHETRKAFIQFDLEMIFQSRNFDDFRLLYRLIHPSRFFPTQDNEDIILEQLFAASKAAGVAVGDDLRANIKLAIEELANGFLESTPGLSDKLVSTQAECDEFHHQILRVVYRLLFLLYAEQRNLMPSASSLYFQEYSITALREKIESGFLPEDDFTDLWEGFKATFQMVYQGVPELNIPNYNGLLFSPDGITALNKCRCRNDNLLKMIRFMTTIEKSGVIQRISYTELGVEEIGSIYEGLLEYIPRVSDQPESFEDTLLIDGKRKKALREIPVGTFFLDPRGTNRKTSGSYYTDKGLVNALIESALAPVLDDRIKSAGPNNDLQAKALLDLKVCDPACGSGAFLIAATEYLGLRLARIRANDDYPADSMIRHARRDVLRHCIYGVDLNPLAVELCKVSLWLTAATDDQPLNFLDHHLKCGNSLVGSTPELIHQGIPVEAYNAIIGDDKEICKQRKAVARAYSKQEKEKKHQNTFDFDAHKDDVVILKGVDYSELFDENTAEEIADMKRLYEDSRKDDEFKRKKMIADYWTAAFFWQHTDLAIGYPNSETLDSLLQNENYDLPSAMKNEVEKLVENYRFFHWHLEFPEVFCPPSEGRTKGDSGFDCLLGNPPWEKVKLQEKEFFALHNPEISQAKSKAEREKLIEELNKNDQQLMNLFNKVKFNSEATSRFIRASNKYPLTSIGDINYYQIFVEHNESISNNYGYCGLIIPTGLITDSNTKTYFKHIVKSQSILSIFDFKNSEKLFSSVDSNMRFILIVISKKEILNSKFGFFLSNTDQLCDKNRLIHFESEEIEMFNPNTFNCPSFKTHQEMKIALLIYNRIPIINNINNHFNPWSISFTRMIDMANDSKHFIREKKENTLPLYESKMFHLYNHRFANAEEAKGEMKIRGSSIYSSLDQLSDSKYIIKPRYYIANKLIDSKLDKKIKWIIAYRKITGVVSNIRTAVFSILPRAAVGDSAPILFTDYDNKIIVSCLFGNFCSLIFDFLARQKVGGLNLNYFILEQLPVLPPDFYSEADIAFIKPRVLELVYTAYDLKPFAEDMGYTGEPFQWDEERRANLKAELDAYYAKLYGLNRKQLRYILDPADLTPRELENILDEWEEVKNPLIEREYQKRCETSTFPGETFRVLKDKENRKYGEYRTRRLVLEKWEEMFGDKD